MMGRLGTIDSPELQQDVDGPRSPAQVSAPVHFLHLGKTGGTALKHAVRGVPGDVLPRAIHLHRHVVTLRDIPGGERFFFFVRDPVSRFVSGFHSRQRQGRPRHFRRWRPEEEAAFGLFHTPDHLARSLSSPDTGERARAEAAMRGIAHVRDSCWKWFESEDYFLSRLPDLFFIGFQATLSQDFEILKRKLGLPADVTLPTGEVEAHRNPPGLDRTLQAESIANLQGWYAEDFRFLDLCHRIIREHPSLRSPDVALLSCPSQAQDDRK